MEKPGTSKQSAAGGAVGNMQSVLNEAKERYPGYNDVMGLWQYKKQLELISKFASDREMRIEAERKMIIAGNLLYVLWERRN